MNASLRIAKIFGIPVQIHWSFALLLIWIFFTSRSQGLGLQETAYLGLFVLALFVCVILHEFGHALTARRYGVGTRDITILPIGGIARLDRMPENPFQEFMVAIAGPLVNVAIALVLSGVYVISAGANGADLQNLMYSVFVRDLPEVDSLFEFFLVGMIALNTVLAVFNMLPAFPMDGGRVLRALLSIRLGRPMATRIAAYLGQFLAVALAIYGLYNGSLITILIGAFVFFAAAAEYRSVRTETFLARYKVSDIVRTQFTRFFTFDSITMAAQALQHGFERDFLIFDAGNQAAGVVSEQELLGAIRENQLDQPLENIMSAGVSRITPQQTLKDVLHTFQAQGDTILAVVDNGEIVGVVDQPMVEHFLRTQQKLKAF